MRVLTIICSIMFFSTLSFSQLNVGIKGAVTMSNFSTSIDDISEAAKSGWQAGAFLRVGDKWHLQPEVYFTAKPGQLKYTQLSPPHAGTVTQDITISAVDVPVLIGFKVIDPPTMNVRLQAGPVASFVTSKTFTMSGDGIDPPEPSEAYKDSFKSVNWGLQFGAGVDFLFLTADLRYELGLSNLVDADTGVTDSGDGEMKNNIFMLSVGFKFM